MADWTVDLWEMMMVELMVDWKACKWADLLVARTVEQWGYRLA